MDCLQFVSYFLSAAFRAKWFGRERDVYGTCDQGRLLIDYIGELIKTEEADFREVVYGLMGITEEYMAVIDWTDEMID